VTKKPKVALPVTKRNQSNVPPPTRHRHDQLVIALKATAHPVLPVIGPTRHVPKVTALLAIVPIPHVLKATAP
jgi:hypothetical protein